jgi:DNA-binding response OmpR family regulator
LRVLAAQTPVAARLFGAAFSFGIEGCKKVKTKTPAEAGGTPHSRVLVVEDEPLLQMLLADILEEGGLAVEIAGSAAEAMDKLRLASGGIAAAILDIGLPDRDGDALLGDLRELYPALRVIIATGRDTAELRARFNSDRNVLVVGKPYASDDLMDALRNLQVACRDAD